VDQHYRLATQALEEGERYLIERDWAWHFLWGRLSYDPRTPAADILRAWVARHGPRAGDPAMRSLMWMSRTIQTLCAAQSWGVDHRDAAPELEIGLLTRNRDHWRSLEELSTIPPLDRTRACSPDQFARAAVERSDEPRLTPIDYATELERLAAQTIDTADELTAMLGEARQANAARTLALEARAVASLGLSGAARLRALTAFAFFQHTKDERWLSKGKEDLDRAAARWNDLAGIADQLYLPVQDPLRAGRDFTWASISAHDQRLQVLWTAALRQSRGDERPVAGVPKLADVYARSRAAFGTPVVSFSRPTKESFAVSVRFPEAAPAPNRLKVLIKPLNSELPWTALDVEKRRGVFAADLKEPANGLLVQFQAVDGEGRGWLWPDSEDGLPFYWSSRAVTAGP
jgi:hypothetical protein